MSRHLPWICAFVGFAVSWLLIRLILQRSILLRVGSGRRQFHQTHHDPVPRFGGLAFAAAFLSVAFIAMVVSPQGGFGSRLNWAIVLASLGIFGLGFLDDFRPLGARWKMLAQVGIAAAVSVSGISIDKFKNPFTDTVYELGMFGIPITIFWLVALTNLINLIDGLDGLAGGIGLMVMCLLAFVGLQVSVTFTTLLALGMAGALLGFLFYNFPPAKIYMGDGGAYLIGFLIGLLGLLNSHKGTVAVAIIAPVIALTLPIADVGLAILRRGVRGLPIFRPDKKHVHHRLMRSGVTPRRAVLMLYAVSLTFVLFGLSLFWEGSPVQPVLIGFSLVMLVVTARLLAGIRQRLGLSRVLDKPMQVRREAQYALAHSRWLELEAERCPTLNALWDDLVFIARKLRFHELRLTISEEERTWRAETPPPAGEQRLVDRHEFEVGDAMALEFIGSAQTLPPKVFYLLTELTAEGWLKAAQRWQTLHKEPFRFTAAASGTGEVPSRPLAASKPSPV